MQPNKKYSQRQNSLKAAEINRELGRERVARYNESPKPCAAGCGVFLLYAKRHNTFCSHSCAAKVNNRTAPKRQRTIHRCSQCGTKVSGAGRRCVPCLRNSRLVKFSKPEFLLLTKAEVSRRDLSYHARHVLFADGPKPCTVCNYTFTVEAAHVRSVKEFPRTAPIKDINGIHNLVPLCPNHHIEFDRGALKLVRRVGVEPT